MQLGDRYTLRHNHQRKPFPRIGVTKNAIAAVVQRCFAADIASETTTWAEQWKRA